jgi:hypothetical protein
MHIIYGKNLFLNILYTQLIILYRYLITILINYKHTLLIIDLFSITIYVR